LPFFFTIYHENYLSFFPFQVSRALPEKQGELEVHLKDFRQLEEQLDHLLLWLSPIRNQLEIYNQPSQAGPFDIKVGTTCLCFHFWQDDSMTELSYLLISLNLITP
jgi:hypothetical protein